MNFVLQIKISKMKVKIVKNSKAVKTFFMFIMFMMTFNFPSFLEF